MKIVDRAALALLAREAEERDDEMGSEDAQPTTVTATSDRLELSHTASRSLAPVVKVQVSTAARLGEAISQIPRIETSVSLEDSIALWLTHLARGESLTCAHQASLKAEIALHGPLALVVVDAWSTAIAADLSGDARTRFLHALDEVIRQG